MSRLLGSMVPEQDGSRRFRTPTPASPPSRAGWEDTGASASSPGSGAEDAGSPVLMQRSMEDFVAYRFPGQTNTLAFFFEPSGRMVYGTDARLARGWSRTLASSVHLVFSLHPPLLTLPCPPLPMQSSWTSRCLSAPRCFSQGTELPSTFTPELMSSSSSWQVSVGHSISHQAKGLITHNKCLGDRRAPLFHVSRAEWSTLLACRHRRCLQRRHPH